MEWLTSNVKLLSLVWLDVVKMVCPMLSVLVVSQGKILDAPFQAGVVSIVCAAAGEASAISAAPQSQRLFDRTLRSL